MSARPTSNPTWPTHREKRRRQHSRKLSTELGEATTDDYTVIARDLYRSGKIPATMLDFVATDRTRGTQS